jgi:hypothetical protein
MLIIGISGKIGTGKSEVAKILLEDLPRKTARLAFGDALKHDCADRFGFALALCYSQEGKLEYIIHPDLPGGCMQVRQILQWYGQKKRQEHPGYWVGRWSALLQGLPADTEYVVVDDVRYPDEKAGVDGRDGLSVRLTPWPGWKPGPHAEHESETALDDTENRIAEWDFKPTRAVDDLGKIAEFVRFLAVAWDVGEHGVALCGCGGGSRTN